MTQGFPQTSIELDELFYMVDVRPAAVTVYGHPPWKEQERPEELSVTASVLVMVTAVS